MGILGDDLVKRISEIVDQKGLKRADLYKIAPSSTLTRWKNGQGPNAYKLYEISKFLGESIDYLVTGKPPGGLSEEAFAVGQVVDRLSPEGKIAALAAVRGLESAYPLVESDLSNKAE
jgi:transcriptional regulator with XRE-family HTH domain